MRILCTNQSLDARGGSESYLETIAPALRQLGHDVELFSPECGAVAARLRDDAFVVHEHSDDLRPTYDVVHAQHASTALTIRSSLPTVPMVFASHSWFFEIEDAPAEALPTAIIVFNDIVGDRARASTLGHRVPVHRLTQPITVGTRDTGRVKIRERATHAFALARNLSTRVGPLREACRNAGIELEVIGRDDTPVDDPRTLMMDADVVFASGRTILEALALGRAAFVYDETGCAGFVTEASYPRLEACGFTPEAGTGEELSTALRSYDPLLGTVGRELVVRHHAAQRHAVALLDIYGAAASPPDAPAPPDVLSRLGTVTQQLFRAQLDASSATWEAAGARRYVQDLEDRLHHARDRLDVAVDRLHTARDRLDSVQDELGSVRAELDAMRGTWSWRVTSPLRWLRRLVR
jgi:hypothetical protein